MFLPMKVSDLITTSVNFRIRTYKICEIVIYLPWLKLRKEAIQNYLEKIRSHQILIVQVVLNLSTRKAEMIGLLMQYQNKVLTSKK